MVIVIPLRLCYTEIPAIKDLELQGGNSLKRIFLAGMILSLAAAVYLPPRSVQAADPPLEGPDRRTTLTVDYTQYQWWLSWYANNSPACSLLTDHESQPTLPEIRSQCTAEVYEAWKKTGACSSDTCGGLYLQQVGSKPAKKNVVVDLPPAAVTVTVTGCELKPFDNRCSSPPYLTFTAEEPLPNEMILDIAGRIGDQPFQCAGAVCTIPLEATGKDGRAVTFWANSSYGDSSVKYTAQVRVVPWGDFMSPEGGAADDALWYVDVISSQWRGATLPSCSDTWMAFSDLGGPPDWLISPQTVEELQSAIPYYYLAGMLIERGAVDASTCEYSGLAGEHNANQCGIQKAMPQVIAWQNRFDQEIFNVSNDTGVPAQLLKRIFSKESQFWPGMYENFDEAGLGQMTEQGADTLLLWNTGFYTDYCPLVLTKETCAAGFAGLNDEHKTTLRLSLVDRVNSTCPTCDLGIDLSKINFSIRVFAENMRANCGQVGRMVYNVTRQTPGKAASYTDLWKFTLANYNSGAGCMADALELTARDGLPLTWEKLKKNLTGLCAGSVDYVNDISGEGAPLPTATVWIQPGAPRPTSTPAPQLSQTPTPARTPSPVPTQPVYPGP